MSFYKIVDHRAPRYYPHNAEPHLVFIPFPIIMGILLFMSPLWIGALLELGIWAVLVAFALYMGVLVRYFHWVKFIPSDHTGYRDTHISSNLVRMRRLYDQNPGMQKDIEPLLISSYKLAKNLDYKGVQERYEMMKKYIATTPKIIAPVQPDPLIEDFKIKLQVREEMIKEGLL